jgi:phosphatidylinositol-3,4,5-trisphosphate 3-phosphatase/dual-specificity protein phosphatase PTEN
MPKPSGGSEEPKTTKLVLTRKEMDFPIGIGSAIVDVEISLEWLRPWGRQTQEGCSSQHAMLSSNDKKTDEMDGGY